MAGQAIFAVAAEGGQTGDDVIARLHVGDLVTDLLDDALSAVYTYFDATLDRRSLGTLAILKQIEWARARGLPHLYLGYWIRDSRKMAYKARYRPLEIWRDGRWQRFARGEALPDPGAG